MDKVPVESLDPAERELLERARVAREGAYAPYSGYQVGAALRTGSAVVWTGANVENASYGLCMCAERVAVFAAVAAGAAGVGGKEIEAIAVVTRDGGSPCGACRQVLVEFNPEMVVLVAGENLQDVWRTTGAGLLPGYFSL